MILSTPMISTILGLTSMSASMSYIECEPSHARYSATRSANKLLPATTGGAAGESVTFGSFIGFLSVVREFRRSAKRCQLGGLVLPLSFWPPTGCFRIRPLGRRSGCPCGARSSTSARWRGCHCSIHLRGARHRVYFFGVRARHTTVWPNHALLPTPLALARVSVGCQA